MLSCSIITTDRLSCMLITGCKHHKWSNLHKNLSCAVVGMGEVIIFKRIKKLKTVALVVWPGAIQKASCLDVCYLFYF